MTTDETVGMSEDERNAFHKGYDDFRKGQRGHGSMSLAQPAAKPPLGLEVAYDKGWRRAEKEGIKEAEKKGHSGECWGYIGGRGDPLRCGIGYNHRDACVQRWPKRHYCVRGDSGRVGSHGNWGLQILLERVRGLAG